jgi:hypothetical protein
MSIVSRALVLSLLLLAAPAAAEITDPEMSCAQYLKTAPGRAHKANHAKAGGASGEVEARVRAFCAANPKMKAIDAELTVTGD